VNYPSIRIEGAILSSDIFERIEEAPGQRPVDFNLDSDAKVKDEIARAWADAQDYWRIFQRKLDTLKADSPIATETRQQWMMPLLGLLGYQLEYQPKGTELNGKNYNISHRASNRAQIPVQIVGYREPSALDRKPVNATLRMSAHGLVQEYLNLSEQLYGLATNGRVLRLLRNSSRLIKLSYLEFDLDRIFTDGLFSDFAILFRLLHASRLPVTNSTAAESLIERYHQDTIEQGTRIRAGLRTAVTEALEILGTGFIAHPENKALRGQIDAGTLEHTVFFGFLLRLIYRLLFLNVVEDRGLIFTKETPVAKLRTYFDYYSVQRLRRLARTRGLKTERHCDAWLSLLSTFELFEHPEQGARLGTTAFGGQLFDPQSLGPLSTCLLSNSALLHALDRLCSFDDPKTKQRLPVNFGALATEEFGAVYESLLELHPIVLTSPVPRFSFKQAAGNDRKTSGSYYTPASLVDCLLDSALNPVLSNRLRNYKTLGFPSAEAAILSLKVCDPACGSGHFLIAAAQRIARRLALVRAGDDEPAPDQLRHALRQVISHCIYAVDINPMSVELCRVALWLEAVEPGKPLSFLDHHIRVGNSLLGTTPELISAGLPDDAFTAIEGDDKKACTLLRKRNKAERSGFGDLFATQDVKTQERLQQAAAALDELPDDRPEDVHRKERAFLESERTEEFRQKKRLADVWCSAFVMRKYFGEPDNERSVIGITQGLINSLADGQVSKHDQPLLDEVQRLAESHHFFHWHLAFPEVFVRGGFDAILGNPPWERVKLQEKEWFAQRRPDIANAPNAAERKRLINRLSDSAEPGDRALREQFQIAVRRSEGESHFMRDSGRYPLCGRGDINLYAIFAEGMKNHVGPKGRVGCVLPTGIATDETTKFFFQDIVSHKSLASLWSFENEDLLFPGVHHAMKFCLLIFGGRLAPSDVAEFIFYARHPDEVQNSERKFSLTADEILLLNPNAKNCPVFRSGRDAEICKALHRRNPVLIREEAPQDNQWGLTFSAMFHMANDSHLFRTRAQLASDGWELVGNKFEKDGLAYLPLYEAKMLHQFNHRFSTYDGATQAQLNVGILPQPDISKLQDPMFCIQPHDWVPGKEVSSTIPDSWKRKWLLGWRDITNSTNERTLISAVIPLSACGDTFLLMFPAAASAENVALLPACLDSFVSDFAARQKVGGTHLKYNVFRQLPVLSPAIFDSICPWSISGKPQKKKLLTKDWLLPRALELTYTAWDLEPFAADCGWSGPPFKWDAERRFLLRCELDAAFFHLYLGTEDEWRRQPDNLTQVFPTPRHAIEHIMDTFPLVRRKDEEKFGGDYRTKRVILEIYDDLHKSIRAGNPFQTRLDPSPADPKCCHPERKSVEVSTPRRSPRSGH